VVQSVLLQITKDIPFAFTLSEPVQELGGQIPKIPKDVPIILIT
jgi:hypothetical protein